jgi:hypothetical protein
MAIAQRKPVQLPDVGGPRAKSLRPFERSGASLRAETIEALKAFERAAVSFPSTDLRLRVAAARAMDELRVEWQRGNLPDELANEIDRWDEGEFAGTRVDLELANYAIAELMGSDVRVDEEPNDA